MVDETSDVSNKEQDVFCVCWVDKNLFFKWVLFRAEMEKIDALSIEQISRKT